MAINKVVYGTTVLVDLTNDSVSPDKLLENTTAHKADGTQITGNIANKGSISESIDGLNYMSIHIPKGYHDGNGVVTLTDDIEEALAEI